MTQSFEYLAANARLSGDEEVARALTQAAKMRDALSALYNLVACMQYVPDDGQPHPIKDGIFDRTVRRARDAMS